MSLFSCFSDSSLNQRLCCSSITKSVSDPAVCLPESKEFPNKRGLVLTESLQGGCTCACLDSSGSFSDWKYFFSGGSCRVDYSQCPVSSSTHFWITPFLLFGFASHICVLAVQNDHKYTLSVCSL